MKAKLICEKGYGGEPEVQSNCLDKTKTGKAGTSNQVVKEESRNGKRGFDALTGNLDKSKFKEKKGERKCTE